LATVLDSSPLELLYRQLSLHQQLDSDDRKLILDLPYKLRTLEAQSYMVREGDRPERCAVLISGYAFRHKLTGEGARQIMSINIPRDALDFQNLFLAESDHNVQALTRVQIAEVSQPHMEALALGHSRVARAILISNLVEASIFREWTLNIGRRDSRSRIAHLLCEFA
jgi:CRP-like cAMP-binding protein